jgi:hypothetical protein
LAGDQFLPFCESNQNQGRSSLIKPAQTKMEKSFPKIPGSLAQIGTASGQKNRPNSCCLRSPLCYISRSVCLKEGSGASFLPNADD